MHRLLKDELEGHPCFDNFIACYMIGSKIPLARIAEYTQLRVSTSPTDLKCVIGWDTMDKKSTATELAPRSGGVGIRFEKGWRSDESGPILGVNPYTWAPSLSETINGSHNKGLLQLDVTTADGENRAGIAGGDGMTFITQMLAPEPTGLVIKGLKPASPSNARWLATTVDAETGILLVATPPAESGAGGMGNSYHIQDFTFFFHNIKENAALRVEAFLKRHQSERQKARPAARL